MRGLSCLYDAFKEHSSPTRDIGFADENLCSRCVKCLMPILHICFVYEKLEYDSSNISICIKLGRYSIITLFILSSSAMNTVNEDRPGCNTRTYFTLFG